MYAEPLSKKLQERRVSVGILATRLENGRTSSRGCQVSRAENDCSDSYDSARRLPLLCECGSNRSEPRGASEHGNMSIVASKSTFARLVVIALFLACVLNFSAFDLRAASASSPGQSQSKDPCDDPAGGHDCFACCAHVVPAALFSFLVQFDKLSLVECAEPCARFSQPASLFHPPKA